MEEVLEELAKCFNIKPTDMTNNPLLTSILKNIDKDDFSKFFNINPKNTDEISSHAIPVNVYDFEKLVEVLFELPGICKKDIKLSLDSDFVLRLSVQKIIIHATNNLKCVNKEIVEGQFSRSISVPESVDRKSISAKYEDGILTVVLLKQYVDVTHINIE